jgi:hypothetical protein
MIGYRRRAGLGQEAYAFSRLGEAGREDIAVHRQQTKNTSDLT